MKQTQIIMGVTSLILGLFSLAVTAIFIISYPATVAEFNVESFRQDFTGLPPTLPFVAASILAAIFSCHSGYGKPAFCISSISAGVMYLLFIV